MKRHPLASSFLAEARMVCVYFRLAAVQRRRVQTVHGLIQYRIPISPGILYIARDHRIPDIVQMKDAYTETGNILPFFHGNDF